MFSQPDSLTMRVLCLHPARVGALSISEIVACVAFSVAFSARYGMGRMVGARRIIVRSDARECLEIPCSMRPLPPVLLSPSAVAYNTDGIVSESGKHGTMR